MVLEDGKGDKNGQMDYSGLYETNARSAILLIASGMDTFSKINFDQARKIVENSGVPIYCIGTGNFFLGESITEHGLIGENARGGGTVAFEAAEVVEMPQLGVKESRRSS